MDDEMGWRTIADERLIAIETYERRPLRDNYVSYCKGVIDEKYLVAAFKDERHPFAVVADFTLVTVQAGVFPPSLFEFVGEFVCLCTQRITLRPLRIWRSQRITLGLLPI